VADKSKPDFGPRELHRCAPLEPNIFVLGCSLMGILLFLENMDEAIQPPRLMLCAVR
jgi:hypothetical protein